MSETGGSASETTVSRPAPHMTAMLAIRIGAVLTPVIFLIYRFAWLPVLVAYNASESRWKPLGVALAILFSAILASGLALLIAIGWLHRRRLRQVFGFSRARLLGAVGMWALTPTAVMGGFPFILLPTLLFLSPAILANPIALVAALPVMGLIFVAWYAASSLLVSGIRRKLPRFLGFCLVWWSVYAFHCLALNLPAFRL
jgi:hypothetical protein